MEELEIRSEQHLALVYTPPLLKMPFALILCFDNSFATLAARGQETILKQMRLTWWREQITKSGTQQSKKEPLLSALSEMEQRHPDLCLPEICLELLDSWDSWVSADAADIETTNPHCAAQRSKAIFGGYARWMKSTSEVVSNAELLGKKWAMQTMGVDPVANTIQLPRALKPLVLLEMTTRFGNRRSTLDRLAGFLRMHIYALTGL